MLITHARPTRPPLSYYGDPIELPAGGVFVAYSSFSEKDTLKDAGFRWGKAMQLAGQNEKGYWYTDDPAIAARLAAYCDDRAAPMVADLVASRQESRVATSTADFPRPEGLDYLPFQKAGIQYALDREATLLADEMGLGKTIQAIGVINSSEPMQHVLVICPATLKRNWARELHKWLIHPLMSVGIATSKHMPPANVVIINYDILGKHAAMLKARPWDLLIVDEAHLAKNPTAARSKAVYAIRALRRLFLTGTPIVNRPAELYPLISHLDPERWHNQQKYLNRYTSLKDRNRGQHLDELQDILRSTVMVRRLKADVLSELPPKRRQILELPAPDSVRQALDAEFRALADIRSHDAGQTSEEWMETVMSALAQGEWAAFEELSALRAATARAKAPLVAEHVADLLDEGLPKVVVFGHHLDALRAIRERLAPYGVVMLTGETKMDDRQGMVDRFQNDERIRVFIGGILAAGVGITLTAADTVVFAELDWVPGNMKQAEDRCHRIGAEGHESILIQHIVLEGSMDVGMSHILVEKIETIEQAMDRATPTFEHAKKTEAPIGSAAAMPVAGGSRYTAADYEALDLTIDQAKAIKRCLEILAGNDPDMAAERNDIGFNGMDTAIGHALAAYAWDLTPKQAATGRRIVAKYHRQLPPGLYAMALQAQPEGVTA